MVDTVVLGSITQQESPRTSLGRHRDLLAQLQKLLVPNKKLSSLLREKIWESQGNQENFMHASHQHRNMTDMGIASLHDDWGLQLELQTPEFDSNESPQQGATVDDRFSLSDLPSNHRAGSTSHTTWDQFNPLSADQQARPQLLASVYNEDQPPMSSSGISRPQDIFDQIQDFVQGPSGSNGDMLMGFGTF